MRLDTWLVRQGYFDSRQRAQGAIRGGYVQSNGQVITKPSSGVGPDDLITVSGDPIHFVSRGGIKLEKAIRKLHLDFRGLTVLDAGASTGGFTDCALRYGAHRVIAVDVGSGQLATALRTNPQVSVFENMDIRHITPEHLGQQSVDAIVADLSFISLVHVLPVFFSLLHSNGFAVVLVKPQFELPKRSHMKGGIVKDAILRRQALEHIQDAASSLGFHIAGVAETEVALDEKKNVEFLLLLRKVNGK